MRTANHMHMYLPLQPPILEHHLIDTDYLYREYQPSEPLKSHIACYWTVDYRANNSRKLHRVIPDGCVDIIFDLRSSTSAKGAFVVGLMTEYEVMTLSQNRFLFGIRFFVDNIRTFLKYPVSEVTGYHVFLEDLWGNEALALTEEIVSEPNVSNMIATIERKFMQMLLMDKAEPDGLLQMSMKYLYSSRGMVTIGALAEELSYSERSIRRTFQKELGVSPKELSDIIRFQNLLKDFSSSPQPRLSDLSFKYGYYDQSHLIRQFKRYYGLPPRQILLPTSIHP